MGVTVMTAELIKFLKEKGYRFSHQGRHMIYVKGKHRVAVPAHRGAGDKGTLNAILTETGFKTKDIKDWRERG